MQRGPQEIIFLSPPQAKPIFSNIPYLLLTTYNLFPNRQKFNYEAIESVITFIFQIISKATNMSTPTQSLPFKSFLNGKHTYKGGPGIDEVSTGNHKVFKLSSNENPIGCSPKALAAFKLASDNLHIYPDRTPLRLQQALSSYYQGKLTPSQFLVANSGSEILELILRGFLGEGLEYIYSPPCFSPYSMFANWQGAIGKHVPLKKPTFQLDVQGILEAVNANTRILFLTSPNNPTGTHIPQKTLITLLENLPEHVIPVLDEVYFHFADAPDYTTALPFIQEGRNLIAVNSFSKTYGLAALRLGYGYTTPEISQYLSQLIRPFFINRPAMEAGIAALSDQDFVRETVALVQQERERLYPILDTLPLTYWKSQGNFILIQPNNPNSALETRLMDKGIMVRGMSGFGAPGCIRVTIGTEEANNAFLKELGNLLA